MDRNPGGEKWLSETEDIDQIKNIDKSEVSTVFAVLKELCVLILDLKSMIEALEGA